MPGSKRRALKQLLSPGGPTPTDTPNLTSPQPLPADQSQSNHHHRTGSGTHGSFSSLLHVPSFGKKDHSYSTSTTSLPRTSTGDSNTSRRNSAIASDSGNYLSDEALNEDLALEASLDEGGGGAHHPTGASKLDGHSLPPPPPINNHSTVPPPQGSSPHAPIDPLQTQAHGIVMSPEPQTTPETGDPSKKGGKKSSKQRFAERQARKQEVLLNSAPPNDPAWNAQLERERQDEIRVIGGACEVLGREIYEIAPDGHCMFNAIADQLYLQGIIPAHQATNALITRRTASNYMLAHPDDFMPFIPSITGEDSAGATDDGMMSEKAFKKYCKLVGETGEWGGEPEIQALSRHFSIPIHVIQRGPPTVVSHGGDEDSFGGVLTPEQSLRSGERVVRISYHRRMYGLGEHYNSLRKVES